MQQRIVLFCLAGLSACTPVKFDQTLATTNQQTADFTFGQLALQRDTNKTQRQNDVNTLLSQTLDQNAAVRVALLNSSAVQALLAQTWAEQAQASQQSRIANPIFSFERLHSADEIEIGRLLTFGLFDLLTLPQRQKLLSEQTKQRQLQLSIQTIELVTKIRQAWVAAVAAQQTLIYSKQVLELADASSALAKRMEQAGNFSKLQQIKHQAFYAEAVNQANLAQHNQLRSREELVRLLGLDEKQAQQLQLPERLPDLPSEPQIAAQVGVSSNRLDIQLAQAQYQSAARAQGLTNITSVTDVELGIRKDGGMQPKQGYEASLRLPLFDWGDAKRDMMNARTLAAANQLDAITQTASSQLRESYSAYRTAFNVAKQYRDEIIPLRKSISDENLLRYNGMLIGVFDLLSDANEQINSVIAAIGAQQQFWHSYAALQASLIGKPSNSLLSNTNLSKSNDTAGH